MTEVLTAGELNRALLARQLLLERTTQDPVAVVAQLAGMQSQAPNPPYLGLAARIDDFAPQEASDRLADRTLVRATAMRGTIHLLVAEDLLAWSSLLRPLGERFIATQPQRGRLAPVAHELSAVVARGAALLHEQALTSKALAAAMAHDWPEVEPAVLALAARFLTPTVQVTPRGLWQTAGPPAFTTVEAWLGRSPHEASSIDDLFLRYLAAFGPATVLDAQAWSGLTRLGPVAHRLRPQLAVFTDDRGRELFDLPHAPRPPEDAPAPVRLIPEWDNLLLAHADKSRIICDDHKDRLFGSKNGIIPAAVLVDGMVEGTWRIERRAGRVTLTLSPFRSWSEAAEAAAVTEADRVLAITDPDAGHRVEVAAPA
ncbi:winged helix DNA-binding domain-containing protein [soil metagenome]